MRSDRYIALIDKLVAASRAPALRETDADRRASDVVTKLVQRQWRHLEREVHALHDDPPDEALHRVRIRAKRCRYAAEAAIPVIGKKAKQFAAAIEQLQTVLGDYQDAVVAEAWLRAAVASVPEAAFAAGELVARQQQERARLRSEWRKMWKAASAKKLHRWLE